MEPTNAAVNTFEAFLNDDSDEESVRSEVIDYYLENSHKYSLVNTCGALGMITGCINNDNYEEALEIVDLYYTVSCNEQRIQWKEWDDTEPNVYKCEEVLASTLRLFRLMSCLLAGDEPDLEQCVVLCDSFYIELLERENEQV